MTVVWGDDRLPLTFWGKTIPGVDGCWHWQGALNSRGYGCFGVRGVSQLSHRVAYEALVGPIPGGLTIDHLCREKRCVNPAHLEPVTARENIARAAEQNRPTHCPYGHEYTPENTITRMRTDARRGVQRACRTCTRAKARAKYREKNPTVQRRSKYDRNTA